jgi:hypothetical protein
MRTFAFGYAATSGWQLGSGSEWLGIVYKGGGLITASLMDRAQWPMIMIMIIIIIFVITIMEAGSKHIAYNI